ncbi:Rha family transcriptional regulator [Lysinibacillus sp. NPDC095746]|uniref:Rha family transcriptional regulator n=1 Tax=Lysinibacillus sp. NPDC095746 TaxID=3364134 RepID=UPI0037F4AD5D
MQNNQAVTTSLQVAETFGKRHDHLIEAIKNLATENLGVKNFFHEDTYQNDRGREYPMFYMNRDGFTLLAMGFTGKKAMQFKIKYIEQFNLMEQQLKSQVTIASYMIEDSIKRAEQWIAEQKEKALLEEKVQEQTVVITHKI